MRSRAEMGTSAQIDYRRARSERAWRRTWWRKLGAAAVSAVVIGVLGAGSPRPISAQTSVQTTAVVPRESIVAFWSQLGDSTLAQLVRETLAANPDVRAAAVRIQRARAEQRLTGFDFAPTVTSAAGYTRGRLAAAQAPGVPAAFREERLLSAGVDAAWEIDVFGRIRNNYRGAGALVASANEDSRFVQVSLVSDLVSAYFQLRGAQEQLAVAQRNSANQQRNLDLTRERLNAGRGTAFDTERAQAQLSSTLAAIPLITSDIASDQNLIAALTGRDSSNPEITVATDTVVPSTVPPSLVLPSLSPALSQAFSPAALLELTRGRPDVQAAERLLSAQSSFVAASRAEYLPRLTVGGSVGSTATGFGSLGEGAASRYVVGPTISWPFLDLGRTRARVDVSRAREEEARQAYRAISLRASSEVSSALSRYTGARARLASLGDAAAASKRAATLARLRFTEGVSDFLQVLDAERTQLDAEMQLTMARTQAAVAFATVYRAAGGSLTRP